MKKLSFYKVSDLNFRNEVELSEDRINNTILEKYQTVVFDLDKTLWNCFSPKGEEIPGYQTTPPYVLQSKEIIVDIKGNTIQLQEGVRELIEDLDNCNKNLGVMSRGEKLIDVERRITIPFSAQPSVMLLKKFDLYKYFNYGVVIKSFVDKKFYVKPLGKTLFIDDDKRWLESVGERKDVDVLGRNSFTDWEDLYRKII